MTRCKFCFEEREDLIVDGICISCRINPPLLSDKGFAAWQVLKPVLLTATLLLLTLTFWEI